MGQTFEIPPQLRSSRSNARRCGRVRCQWTLCNIGEVIDISATGMRIRSRRKPAAQNGSRIAVIVEGIDGSFDVSGRIVWRKKVGFFRWEVGVELDEPSADVRKGLSLIARSALANESLAVQARRSA